MADQPEVPPDEETTETRPPFLMASGLIERCLSCNEDEGAPGNAPPIVQQTTIAEGEVLDDDNIGMTPTSSVPSSALSSGFGLASGGGMSSPVTGEKIKMAGDLLADCDADHDHQEEVVVTTSAANPSPLGAKTAVPTEDIDQLPKITISSPLPPPEDDLGPAIGDDDAHKTGETDELKASRRLLAESLKIRFMTLLDAFKAIDTDNNSSIDVSELHTAIDNMGLSLTPEAINAIFHAYDADQNMQIDYLEFLKLCGEEHTLQGAAFENSNDDELFQREIGAGLQGKFADIITAFRHFDVNDDGRLALSEIIAGLQKEPLALTISEDQSRALFRLFNAKEQIDYAEFLKLFGSESFRPAQREAGEDWVDNLEAEIQLLLRGRMTSLTQTFRQMDKNNDGQLSRDEFRKGLEQIGVKLKTHQIKELWKRVDVDGDGSIQYNEFAAKFSKFGAMRKASARSAGATAAKKPQSSGGVSETVRQAHNAATAQLPSRSRTSSVSSMAASLGGPEPMSTRSLSGSARDEMWSSATAMRSPNSASSTAATGGASMPSFTGLRKASATGGGGGGSQHQLVAPAAPGTPGTPPSGSVPVYYSPPPGTTVINDAILKKAVEGAVEDATNKLGMVMQQHHLSALRQVTQAVDDAAANVQRVAVAKARKEKVRKARRVNAKEEAGTAAAGVGGADISNDIPGIISVEETEEASSDDSEKEEKWRAREAARLRRQLEAASADADACRLELARQVAAMTAKEESLRATHAGEMSNVRDEASDLRRRLATSEAAQAALLVRAEEAELRLARSEAADGANEATSEVLRSQGQALATLRDQIQSQREASEAAACKAASEICSLKEELATAQQKALVAVAQQEKEAARCAEAVKSEADTRAALDGRVADLERNLQESKYALAVANKQLLAKASDALLAKKRAVSEEKNKYRLGGAPATATATSPAAATTASGETTGTAISGDAEEVLASLRTEVSTLQGLVSALQADNADLGERHAALEASNKDLETAAFREHEQLRRRIQTYEVEVQALAPLREDAKALCRAKLDFDRERDNWRETDMERAQREGELRKQIKTLVATNRELEDRCSRLQIDVTKASAHAKQADVRAHDVERARRLQLEVDSLQSQMEEMTARHYEAKLSMETQIQGLHAQLRDSNIVDERRTKKLQAQLRVVERERDAAEAMVDDVRRLWKTKYDQALRSGVVSTTSSKPAVYVRGGKVVGGAMGVGKGAGVGSTPGGTPTLAPAATSNNVSENQVNQFVSGSSSKPSSQPASPSNGNSAPLLVLPPSTATSSGRPSASAPAPSSPASAGGRVGHGKMPLPPSPRSVRSNLAPSPAPAADGSDQAAPTVTIDAARVTELESALEAAASREAALRLALEGTLLRRGVVGSNSSNGSNSNNNATSVLEGQHGEGTMRTRLEARLTGAVSDLSRAREEMAALEATLREKQETSMIATLEKKLTTAEATLEQRQSGFGRRVRGAAAKESFATRREATTEVDAMPEGDADLAVGLLMMDS